MNIIILELNNIQIVTHILVGKTCFDQGYFIDGFIDVNILQPIIVKCLGFKFQKKKK